MSLFVIILISCYLIFELTKSILQGHFRGDYCLWSGSFECLATLLGIVAVIFFSALIFIFSIFSSTNMSEKDIINGMTFVFFNYLSWLFINSYENNKNLISTVKVFFARFFILILSTLLIGLILILFFPFSNKETNRS